MSRTEKREYWQPELEFTGKENEGIVRFPRGTTIYPENSGRGSIGHDVLARKLPNKKISNLTAYEALTPVDMTVFSRHGAYSRTLPKGSKFGAYASKARKPKRLKKN